MAKQMHVAANLQQDFTDVEKTQARTNIGAVDIDAVNDAKDYADGLVQTLGNSKQDNLTAGHGITIASNIISSDFSLKKVSTSLPPVETEITNAKVYTDGRVLLDNTYIGVMAPYPYQVDAGKVLVANYVGSPAIGTARWASLIAGSGINISGTTISSTAVQTTQHNGVGSPSDTPYDLLTYDGLEFTFQASSSACSLKVSSTDVATISGLVEHISDSNQVSDGKTLFSGQSISSAYILYTMNQYEIASTVNEVLKIKLWYTKDGTPKSLTMNVLKTGQVNLDISIIGG